MRLSRPVLFTPFFLLAFLHLGCKPAPPPQAAGQDSYLFCFWNVENLFDDRLDGRTGPGDKEYDVWLSSQPADLKHKLDKLTEALLKLNDGKGPDILAMVEVECVRAAELLQKALNDKITDPKLHYANLLMKEQASGRHIAPAILTRLPVVRDRTRLLGSRQRTLEGRINLAGHELVVLASHWTSRKQEGSDKRRAQYADTLYGAYRAMHTSNPHVDVLICGDFNDSPDDVSVSKHLQASGDVQAVMKNSSPPLLLNLMAGKDPARGYGTHYYAKWFVFDQIVVSPGMVDATGWSCEPSSVKTINTLTRPGDRIGRPWRFGNEKDRGPRGYSDHFPVTVRLKVH